MTLEIYRTPLGRRRVAWTVDWAARPVPSLWLPTGRGYGQFGLFGRRVWRIQEDQFVLRDGVMVRHVRWRRVPHSVFSEVVSIIVSPRSAR